MEKTTSIVSNEKAETNFNNIKKSLKGIYSILKISLNEQDIYFQAGIDNVLGLYRNFLELMLNEPGNKKLAKKLKNSEIDVDIILNDLIAED